MRASWAYQAHDYRQIKLHFTGRPSNWNISLSPSIRNCVMNDRFTRQKKEFTRRALPVPLPEGSGYAPIRSYQSIATPNIKQRFTLIDCGIVKQSISDRPQIFH